MPSFLLFSLARLGNSPLKRGVLKREDMASCSPRGCLHSMSQVQNLDGSLASNLSKRTEYCKTPSDRP
jgi:hypothetical protein